MMNEKSAVDRRAFLKDLARVGGVALVAGCAGPALASGSASPAPINTSLAQWRDMDTT